MSALAALLLSARAHKFRIGDRIRIIAIPESARALPRAMRDGPDGTLTVFKFLLASKRVYSVSDVDPKCGWPWIQFIIVGRNRVVYHDLLIEPECVQRVELRQRKG